MSAARATLAGGACLRQRGEERWASRGKARQAGAGPRLQTRHEGGLASGGPRSERRPETAPPLRAGPRSPSPPRRRPREGAGFPVAARSGVD